MPRPWWASPREFRAQWRAMVIAVRVAIDALNDGCERDEAKQLGRDAGEAYLRRLNLRGLRSGDRV